MADLDILLLTVNEFHSDPLIISRYKASIMLLFVLDIRINELRQTQINDIKLYLEDQSLQIAIAKSKTMTLFLRKSVVLTKTLRVFVRRVKNEYASSEATRKLLNKF